MFIDKENLSTITGFLEKLDTNDEFEVMFDYTPRARSLTIDKFRKMLKFIKKYPKNQIVKEYTLDIISAGVSKAKIQDPSQCVPIPTPLPNT